jgi:hypothetical protein
MFNFNYQKTCFDSYNQTRKKGIKFRRYYILKDSIRENRVAVLYLGKTLKETALLSVNQDVVSNHIKKFAHVVFLTVDQLEFLKKVSFKKIKFKSKFG